jgi:hypothetical protein
MHGSLSKQDELIKMLIWNDFLVVESLFHIFALTFSI